MRIAIVAPLIEAVPPPFYGGTERVVSVLTEELVCRGHRVTLFASGDSRTAAELAPCCPHGLRLDPNARDYVAGTMIELAEVYRRADEFDVIHNHVDYLSFPFARASTTPTVTTTHGRLDLQEVRRLYRQFPEHRFVSISRSQRDSFPDLTWAGTVYNAIDVSAFRFEPKPGDYLVFLGRMSPEKRPDRAIEIARELGMPLMMAAKVDPAVDGDYFERVVAPLIDASPLVEFLGEVDESEKNALLGGAFAYLFPIDWPEPFGLTMVEAMATGTPVVAYGAGSVPEIVVDGVTGFVCNSVSEMAQAIRQVGTLDRWACRRHVELHFSPATMANGYEAVYQRIVDTAGYGHGPGHRDRIVSVFATTRPNSRAGGLASLDVAAETGPTNTIATDAIA